MASPQELINGLHEAPVVGVKVRKELAVLQKHLEQRRERASLVFVRGPPSSGKTRFCKDLLKQNYYDVKTFSNGITASAMVAEAVSFANMRNSVQNLLRGVLLKKAIFLDDMFFDSKTLKKILAECQKVQDGIVIVACSCRSRRLQDIHKKADCLVNLCYPAMAETVRYLRGLVPATEHKHLARCVKTAEGCIHRSLLHLESRRHGYSCENQHYDTTIMQDVDRTMKDIWNRKIPYASVESAISSEPMLACLIAVNSAHRQVPEPGDYARLVRDYAEVSSIPGIQPAIMTNLFARTGRLTRDPSGKRVPSGSFPKCYTIQSSRVGALMKKK